MTEYINRRMTPPELEQELLTLIQQYNEKTGRTLFVYSATFKPIEDASLSMDDYYVVYDILRGSKVSEIDIYLETPGGRGEAAEEIVKFLRTKFSVVNFIISGEAKSAGTIMALSGDDILMTKTGSLGPIDAQIPIGRTVVSADDYMEWVKTKSKEAEEKGVLNNVDAIMVAQINPGELTGVNNALNYAKDLVKEWLPLYKFKDWETTETRKIEVTPEMKANAAERVVNALVNHTKWRTHGKSLKIKDMKNIGLRITELDSKAEIAEIVYRIQTIIRMLYVGPAYKIYATADEKIFRNAGPMPLPIVPGEVQPNQADSVNINLVCENCGQEHKLLARLLPGPITEARLLEEGVIDFPHNNVVKCKCGNEINLTQMRAEIESQTGKSIIGKK